MEARDDYPPPPMPAPSSDEDMEDVPPPLSAKVFQMNSVDSTPREASEAPWGIEDVVATGELWQAPPTAEADGGSPTADTAVADGIMENAPAAATAEADATMTTSAPGEPHSPVEARPEALPDEWL